MWKFYFPVIPLDFAQDALIWKDDNVSTLMQMCPVLSEITPPRTVVSCGFDTIERQDCFGIIIS